MTDNSEQSQIPPTSNTKLRARAVVGETELHDWEARCLIERTPACKRVYLADEADAELERLTRERDEARQTCRGWLSANAPGGWIDRLRAALVKHGTHATGCANQRNVGECSCGLWTALSGEPGSGHETFVRLARHGHFWTVEELQDGRWARAAQGHAWALEADARQQCEELRRRHGERLYRVTEYGSPQKAKAE